MLIIKVTGNKNQRVANVWRIIPEADGSSYKKAANGARKIDGSNIIEYIIVARTKVGFNIGFIYRQ